MVVFFYKEDGHQGAALPTYTKALGLVFHHSHLGMNMSHVAHDILETCYVQNSGMTEPKWSGLHGSRRCTKNKTHGIVGTREVSSHGNLFTPTWKSFAQALKSGWARLLHKILFRMRFPEKLRVSFLRARAERKANSLKQRFCNEGCTPSTHPISISWTPFNCAWTPRFDFEAERQAFWGPSNGVFNPGATMTSHQKWHPATLQ
jgi:hypothetical protein